MTMSGVRKTLTGITVGLSIAETSEIAALGVNAAEMNHMADVIAKHLLAHGGELARAPGALCHARICIGGQTEVADGRDPNIVEDALATLEAQQPLYLSGVIGGVAAHVISALRQAPIPANFGPAHRWKHFKSIGVAGLAQHNGLSVEENETLFKATNMFQIAEAVVLGLSRLRHGGHL